MKETLNIIKFTEWESLKEFQIPNVKLDEFLYNIKITNNKYKKIIIDYYKSYDQYVDIIDKRKHQYKINDLTGDILGSERVVFKSIIFDNDDINNIRNNMVSFALSDFYNGIPDSVDVFGIKLKPLSFIDKDSLKFTFEQTITIDTTLNIITTLSNMNYENEFNGYYIWSDKINKNKNEEY
jgi:hypothetical protein